MRAFILALLAGLWLSSGPAEARNGETGILIVIRNFEVQTDKNQNRVFVICQEDWEHLQDLLIEGQDARIYLQGYGVYDVQVDGSGSLRIHQVETAKEQTFSLMSHECPVDANDSEVEDSPSC